ncbi:MAG: 2Fe-2S iron-sulfur cluster-binding protein [Chloroflexota bacterium]
MTEELGKVKMFRYDPGVDTEPKYVEYQVPYEGRTVLDVLRYIYENQDSTFAYRWACTKGFCRACVLSVNGKGVLACMKSAEKDMKIDPHPKYPLVKDLLVDFEGASVAPE